MQSTNQNRFRRTRGRGESCVRALWAIGLSLTLAGCQYIADSNRAYRIEHDIPDDSTLIVEQPLPVAAGRRDLYIQFGQVQAFGQIDRYYPHCEIVLKHLSEGSRVLPAGRYAIYGAEPYVDPHAQADAPVMVASMGLDGDPAPSPQLYATRMTLRGPPGADVKEMICGELYDPYEARYPTIDDIREIMGKLARLEVRGRD